MNRKLSRDLVGQLLQSAGITINGNHAWDVKIYNENVYNRVVQQGALGLGESYMDGWWDCHQLDEFFYRIVRSRLDQYIQNNFKFIVKLLLAKIINFQSKKHAFDVGKKHYDLGNFLFECMLDTRMNYTCGYWKNADNLDDAQLAKMELVCKKLNLQPGMRMLDIGCGWGALAKHAAEKYGVQVTGITVSKEQMELARKNCAGLPVEIILQDYRDVKNKFDRIVSLGMFEHVGHLNYRIYMETAHRCLQDDGLFLLHTIGTNETGYQTNEWTQKYIFAQGMLPSIAQIGHAAEKLFIMEDWHNFGADYNKTLLAWHANFNRNWDKLNTQFDQRFYRMWNYYLLSSAGDFRARDMQLWQIVFSKKGVPNGYQAPR